MKMALHGGGFCMTLISEFLMFSGRDSARTFQHMSIGTLWVSLGSSGEWQMLKRP